MTQEMFAPVQRGYAPSVGSVPWQSQPRWNPRECLPSGFARSAVFWTAHGFYREPQPPEAFERWRHGWDFTTDLWAWLAPSRAAIAAGCTITRIGVHTDPPTEFQRWQVAASPLHKAVGEHLATVDEDAALSLGLPAHDFWLLDDETVLVADYRYHIFRSTNILRSASDTAPYRHWVGLAWRHAMLHTSDHSTVE